MDITINCRQIVIEIKIVTRYRIIENIIDCDRIKYHHRLSEIKIASHFSLQMITNI